MNVPSLPSRLVPVLLSFAVGFGLAWLIRAPDAAPPGPVASTVQPAAGPGFGDAWSAPPAAAQASAHLAAATLPPAAGVDALWASALQPGERGEAAYQAEDRLRKLAQTDPAARRKLIGFYDTAQTTQARDLLKTILSTVQAPDVVFLANRLANSGNLVDRTFGFDMLRSVAPNAPETRSLARRVLASEQSPAVLIGALSALQAGAADPDEAAQVVAQLTTLSQHADPVVRSRSLQQLGQWDKSGESGPRLAQAPGRQRARGASGGDFRDCPDRGARPGRQDSLLALAANGQESRDVRGSALQVLERFPLSKEDYAHFARLRAQLQAQ
ncbi:hypothetical protein G4G28_20845 [Massilia sp. Dwa41.01b]|uniref:hypothetical protein n=1 Tax=Massilia sp. Dwa41.01b TaxID=2709302 RepID=UPI0016004DEB|nr:hypothetical protein [Massilia sp. Dwa41.01b]QNA90337.1 hypothetical protein G4G28_20845 [Massilia sp. Dwa41.01b]